MTSIPRAVAFERGHVVGGYPVAHFVERFKERGPAWADPLRVAEVVYHSVRMGGTEHVQYVSPSSHSDRAIWRLVLGAAADNVYVIVSTSNGVPVTVMTQEQVRYFKQRRRALRKHVARSRKVAKAARKY